MGQGQGGVQAQGPRAAPRGRRRVSRLRARGGGAGVCVWGVSPAIGFLSRLEYCVMVMHLPFFPAEGVAFGHDSLLGPGSSTGRGIGLHGGSLLSWGRAILKQLSASFNALKKECHQYRLVLELLQLNIHVAHAPGIGPAVVLCLPLSEDHILQGARGLPHG